MTVQKCKNFVTLSTVSKSTGYIRLYQEIWKSFYIALTKLSLIWPWMLWQDWSKVIWRMKCVLYFSCLIIIFELSMSWICNQIASYSIIVIIFYFNLWIYSLYNFYTPPVPLYLSLIVLLHITWKLLIFPENRFSRYSSFSMNLHQLFLLVSLLFAILLKVVQIASHTCLYIYTFQWCHIRPYHY